MWDSEKKSKVKTQDIVCSYHPSPIKYPIYINSFTQQIYSMKTGLPKLHTEMIPDSCCYRYPGLWAKEAVTSIIV